jgi:hypothetical protein
MDDGVFHLHKNRGDVCAVKGLEIPLHNLQASNRLCCKKPRASKSLTPKFNHHATKKITTAVVACYL